MHNISSLNGIRAAATNIRTALQDLSRRVKLQLARIKEHRELLSLPKGRVSLEDAFVTAEKYLSHSPSLKSSLEAVTQLRMEIGILTAAARTIALPSPTGLMQRLTGMLLGVFYLYPLQIQTAKMESLGHKADKVIDDKRTCLELIKTVTLVSFDFLTCAVKQVEKTAQQSGIFPSADVCQALRGVDASLRRMYTLMSTYGVEDVNQKITTQRRVLDFDMRPRLNALEDLRDMAETVEEAATTNNLAHLKRYQEQLHKLRGYYLPYGKIVGHLNLHLWNLRATKKNLDRDSLEMLRILTRDLPEVDSPEIRLALRTACQTEQAMRESVGRENPTGLPDQTVQAHLKPATRGLLPIFSQLFGLRS